MQRLTLAQVHHVLSHINYGAVKHAIQEGLVMGIELNKTSEEEFCKACAMVKPHHKPFPKKAQN
jgi:hypothetical protein